jgi:zinc protease
MLKDYDTNAKSNGNWLGILREYYRYNYDGFNGYKDVLNGITAADVSNFVKNSILNTNNRIELIMTPEQ